MGIYSALSVGHTALMANQLGLEVTGNNIANATTPNYSRQEAVLVPTASIGSQRVGTGVRVQSIMRRYDNAVEARLRSAISETESRAVQQQNLDRLEGLYNETTDNDLSSALNGFFNSFSALGSTPSESGLRTTAVSKANDLVNMIQTLRNGMDELRNELNTSVVATVDEINRTATDIAELNVKVLAAEQGDINSAPSLRDARDARLQDLSRMINIRIVEQNSGAVNVIVGNQTLVDGRNSRELGIFKTTDRAMGVTNVRFLDNNESVTLTGGSLEGLITSRDAAIGEQIDSLDQLARSVIFEVNSLHSEGVSSDALNKDVPAKPYTSEETVLDANATLSDAVATGLKFQPVNGTFMVHVTNIVSKESSTAQIKVDLDGLGVDDSLADVAAKLSGIDNVTAYVNAAGHLVVGGASPEIRLSFAEDSSHLLAAVGINTLFKGYDSATISLVAGISIKNAGGLATSLSSQSDDGQNANAIAGLINTRVQDLGGKTLCDFHTETATQLAVNVAAAKSASEAAQAFQATMNDERESISGVNLDEETVNLIRYQKAYAASAKFMSTMAELLDKIMQI